MSSAAINQPQHETFLDRIGIPHSLRWGFLGVLVFMTGNGTESNFISPHIEAVLGSPEATVATIITGYSLAVLVASYLSGALADLWGPRRVMTLGVAVWVVFEVLFLLSLQLGSLPLVALTYFLRGFGYPLFAFAFLVWINVVTPYERNGVAVGWFYVMFTGGLPTLGSLFAIGMIPAFGGATGGETAAMVGSTALVVAGYLIARFGVHEPHATRRLAPAGESTAEVLTAGLRLTARNTGSLDWLPQTCAYRLRAAGEALPEWHYLISGDREAVHRAGQSVRGWTVSEDEVGDLEDHMVDRVL